MKQTTKTYMDILLVVTTDVEFDAVLKCFNKTATESEFNLGGKNHYYDLSWGSDTKINMVFSPKMGSGGPGGSQATIDDAIREMHPEAVIMVGVAFGVDDKKQTVGDILVSEDIYPYEHQRVGSTTRGQYEIIPRNGKKDASIGLLTLFRAGSLRFKESINEVTNKNRIRFGTILSGEKLVDNFDYREQLRKNFAREAIGGEMEGAGLYASANRHGTEWILVKAICDFADGHKSENKAERQKRAASNVATFVAYVLGQGEHLKNPRDNYEKRPGGHAGEKKQIDQPKDNERFDGKSLMPTSDQVMNIVLCAVHEVSPEAKIDDTLQALLKGVGCDPSDLGQGQRVRFSDHEMVTLFHYLSDAMEYALDVRDRVLHHDWYSVGRERPPSLRVYISKGDTPSCPQDFIIEDSLKPPAEMQQSCEMTDTEPVTLFFWNRGGEDVSSLTDPFFLEELDCNQENAERLYRVFRSEEESRCRPLYDEQYYRREKVLRRFSHLWLLLDQLPCGSWGRSIPIWMRNVWRNCPTIHPTEHMEEEGGFETTILTLDILCKIHGTDRFYEYFERSALNGYLKARQDTVGGIGPLGSERMGLAIQSRPRHTALALWFIAENLLSQGCNPGDIEEIFQLGVRYLFLSQWDIEAQFANDSNPVMLFMCCWHLVRLIKNDRSVRSALGSDELERIPTIWDEEIVAGLLKSVMRSTYEPIPRCGCRQSHSVWPLTVPYGGFARMELYSFLSAAQFIHPDMPQEVITLFRKGIERVQLKYLENPTNRSTNNDERCGHGLRYLKDKLHHHVRGIPPFYADISTSDSGQSPDIGATSMLLRVLRNKKVISALWPDELPDYLAKVRFFLSEDLNTFFDKYLSDPELYELTNAGMLAGFLVQDDSHLLEEILVPTLPFAHDEIVSRMDDNSLDEVLSEKRIDMIINEKVAGTSRRDVCQVASFSLSRHLLDYVRPGRYITDKLSSSGRQGISERTLEVYRDPAFVQKFASVWKDQVNSAMVEPFLEKLKHGSQILDVGCGVGQYALEFEKRGFTVTRLDGSKEMLNYATAGQDTKDNVFECNIMSSDDRRDFSRGIGSSCFDGIWCSGTLAHVPKSGWAELLQWFNSMLQERGVLFANVMIDNPRVFAYDHRFFVYIRKSNDFIEVLENSGFCVDQSLSSYISKNTYSEPNFRANWVNVFASKISRDPNRQAETEATSASIMTAHAYQRSVQQFVEIHSKNTKRDAIVNRTIDKLSTFLAAECPVVLDAGCGPGDHLREMAHRGWMAYGIDISPGMVGYCAKENARSSYSQNISVDVGNIEKLPDEWEAKFDAVISITVFQHLHDHRAIKVLQEFTRVLKPGGVIRIDVQEGRTRGFDPDLRFIEGYTGNDDVFKRLRFEELGLTTISTENWRLPIGRNTYGRPVEFEFLEIWLKKSA